MLTLAAELVLYFALSGKLADCDSDRDSDEVCVIELDSRSLITVVYHYFNAHRLEFLLDVVSYLQLCLVFRLDYCHDNMIRSDGQRPDDSLVVMMLLYYSLHRSCDSYAVATHPVRMIYTIFVLERGIHTLGVLESQLEDLTDLDTASELDRLSAVWAAVAFLKRLDIRNDIACVVSAVADTCQVVVFFVCACAHVDCTYELCIYYYDAVLARQQTRCSVQVRSER